MRIPQQQAAAVQQDCTLAVWGAAFEAPYALAAPPVSVHAGSPTAKQSFGGQQSFGDSWDLDPDLLPDSSHLSKQGQSKVEVTGAAADTSDGGECAMPQDGACLSGQKCVRLHILCSFPSNAAGQVHA